MGAKIKAWRVASGIAQQKIARLIGINQSAYSAKEDGSGALRYGEAVLLTAALAHPIDPTRGAVLCPNCYNLPPSGFSCTICGRDDIAERSGRRLIGES